MAYEEVILNLYWRQNSMTGCYIWDRTFIVVEDDMVLFCALLISMPVDFHLSLTVFVRNPLLLALIVGISLITNPVWDDSEMKFRCCKSVKILTLSSVFFFFGEGPIRLTSIFLQPFWGDEQLSNSTNVLVIVMLSSKTVWSLKFDDPHFSSSSTWFVSSDLNFLDHMSLFFY